MKTLAPQLIFGLLTLSVAIPAKLPPDAVQLVITRASRSEGSLHWKIVNRSGVEVYVYDVFLLGPAYNTERFPDKVIFDATPITTLASCPPNRNPPVLLLVIRSGGSIEGDFSDPKIRTIGARRVSLKISVGPEPYTVVSLARQFEHSDCKHSPYDAIVLWGTLIESNTVQVSE